MLVAFFVSYFILNYADGGTVINAFFFFFAVGSLCMEMYLPLIQSFECLLITSGKGFRMGIRLNKGFLINIVYCIPVSIFTKYVLFFAISLNKAMIRVNSYQISLNKNTEKNL